MDIPSSFSSGVTRQPQSIPRSSPSSTALTSSTNPRSPPSPPSPSSPPTHFAGFSDPDILPYHHHYHHHLHHQHRLPSQRFFGGPQPKLGVDINRDANGLGLGLRTGPGAVHIAGTHMPAHERLEVGDEGGYTTSGLPFGQPPAKLQPSISLSPPASPISLFSSASSSSSSSFSSCYSSGDGVDARSPAISLRTVCSDDASPLSDDIPLPASPRSPMMELREEDDEWDDDEKSSSLTPPSLTSSWSSMSSATTDGQLYASFTAPLRLTGGDETCTSTPEEWDDDETPLPIPASPRRRAAALLPDHLSDEDDDMDEDDLAEAERWDDTVDVPTPVFPTPSATPAPGSQPPHMHLSPPLALPPPPLHRAASAHGGLSMFDTSTPVEEDEFTALSFPGFVPEDEAALASYVSAASPPSPPLASSPGSNEETPTATSPLLGKLTSPSTAVAYAQLEEAIQALDPDAMLGFEVAFEEESAAALESGGDGGRGSGGWLEDVSPPSPRQAALGLAGDSDSDDDDDTAVDVPCSPSRRRSVTLPSADLPEDEPKIDVDVDPPIPTFVASPESFASSLTFPADDSSDDHAPTSLLAFRRSSAASPSPSILASPLPISSTSPSSTSATLDSSPSFSRLLAEHARLLALHTHAHRSELLLRTRESRLFSHLESLTHPATAYAPFSIGAQFGRAGVRKAMEFVSKRRAEVRAGRKWCRERERELGGLLVLKVGLVKGGRGLASASSGSSMDGSDEDSESEDDINARMPNSLGLLALPPPSEDGSTSSSSPSPFTSDTLAPTPIIPRRASCDDACPPTGCARGTFGGIAQLVAKMFFRRREACACRPVLTAADAAAVATGGGTAGGKHVRLKGAPYVRSPLALFVDFPGPGAESDVREPDDGGGPAAGTSAVDQMVAKTSAAIDDEELN